LVYLIVRRRVTELPARPLLYSDVVRAVEAAERLEAQVAAALQQEDIQESAVQELNAQVSWEGEGRLNARKKNISCIRFVSVVSLIVYSLKLYLRL
jgi:hypothetical protein